jgi:hypothetical protein
METPNVKLICKNNVVIVLTQDISGMWLDRFIVIIVEPDGERFAVLDIRTFVDYLTAVEYCQTEQAEHNNDNASEADWYNGGKVQ